MLKPNQKISKISWFLKFHVRNIFLILIAHGYFRKKAFQNNELDKYAEKYGKKIKKQTVNEKLYDDLRTAREILTKSFGAWNENVDKEILDEGVQRIIRPTCFYPST